MLLTDKMDIQLDSSFSDMAWEAGKFLLSKRCRNFEDLFMAIKDDKGLEKALEDFES